MITRELITRAVAAIRLHVRAGKPIGASFVIPESAIRLPQRAVLQIIRGINLGHDDEKIISRMERSNATTPARLHFEGRPRFALGRSAKRPPALPRGQNTGLPDGAPWGIDDERLHELIIDGWREIRQLARLMGVQPKHLKSYLGDLKPKAIHAEYLRRNSEDIVAEARRGKTISEIARRWNSPRSVMAQFLRDRMPSEPRAPALPALPEVLKENGLRDGSSWGIDDNRLFDLIISGHRSVASLARAMGVPYLRMKKYFHKGLSPSVIAFRHLQHHSAELEALESEGVTRTEIARRWHASRHMVNRVLGRPKPPSSMG